MQARSHLAAADGGKKQIEYSINYRSVALHYELLESDPAPTSGTQRKITLTLFGIFSFLAVHCGVRDQAAIGSSVNWRLSTMIRRCAQPLGDEDCPSVGCSLSHWFGLETFFPLLPLDKTWIP